MRMTIEQFLDSLSRGMTPEEYHKWRMKMRRLSNERYTLMDRISVLEYYGDCDKDSDKLGKLKKRLEKVESMLSEMQGRKVRTHEG